MKNDKEYDVVLSLLNDIEENSQDSDVQEPMRLVMCECLTLIESKMPPIAKEALEVARRPVDPASAKAAKMLAERCWQYLDEELKGVETKDPRVSSIRACLFVLGQISDPAKDDVVDPLDVFLHFANNVEPHLSEQEQLLRKHFAKWM